MTQKQSGSGSSIGWAIVGTGTIAKQFAADLACSKQSVLSAVCSRSTDKANAFASRYGAAASYASLPSLLADENVDIVYVASPNDTHFATAHAALDAGKAVLVEKPLVLTVSDAEQLSALSKQCGRFLMEAMWTRFLPAVSFVKDAVSSGTIGEVIRFESDLAFHHAYSPESRFFDKTLGGGALFDLGIYPISLAIALMGYPDAVEGSWTAAPGGVDSSATVRLAFGAVEAELSCAIDRTGANLFAVVGTTGTLVLQAPFIGAQSLLHLTGGPFAQIGLARGSSIFSRAARYVARNVPLPGITHRRFDFPGYGLQFEIDAAADAVARGLTEHPVAPLSDSVEALRIIETILRKPPGNMAPEKL